MGRLVVALVILGAVLPAIAQRQPEHVSPVAPENGASTGKKPRFVVSAEGADVEKLRFRIQLSADGFKSIAYAFDQKEDPQGWAVTALPGQSPAGAYFPKEPLRGGDYLWRVSSWDGLGWKDGSETFRLRIDDVPPADVEGVMLRRPPGAACVHVEWRPVTVDRDGRPEQIAQYHVYRYAAKGAMQPIRPFEAGRTPTLQFEDCDAETAASPILYYKVVAEDTAGNIPGRRY